MEKFDKRPDAEEEETKVKVNGACRDVSPDNPKKPEVVLGAYEKYEGGEDGGNNAGGKVQALLEEF